MERGSTLASRPTTLNGKDTCRKLWNSSGFDYCCDLMDSNNIRRVDILDTACPPCSIDSHSGKKLSLTQIHQVCCSGRHKEQQLIWLDCPTWGNKTSGQLHVQVVPCTKVIKTSLIK
ncbi:uncharacterized protein LOC110978589 [Acanthaster planci]|uniref:Uncharacterized protein LOC110978589 n=1 Tax=Acanthaster planci TaxID=133434 RepID=A0A8B7Y848_ACAPL|nr:uncharacterized protein LOC110978589 [Acanthaster planci]